MCFNDWLERRCRYTPESIAAVDDARGQRYSYAELNERARRLAQHLQHELGVLPGDRVACLSGNRLEYLDLYFACGKIGALLVPLNYRLPATAIQELLADCCVKVLVYESVYWQCVELAQQAGLVPRRWLIDGPAPGTSEHSVSQVAGDSSMSADFDVCDVDESDIAMILYTSGTTGRPKGALISYRQIHYNALNTIIGLQLTEHDTALLNMPLYHTGGWHVLFTPLMLLGGRVILQQQFDAPRCNQLLGVEQITILFGVPTTLRMMQEAENFAAADFSSVRFAIFGGERCPLPVIEAYAKRGVAMRQGYGLTEAGPNCFSLPAEDALRKEGSIGFPNFFVRTRLEREDGVEARHGEVGQLLMRGPHVFSGYWNNVPATREVLHDGWVATGDLMTCDEEGHFYVVGRKKDMYVSGGENVYPAQVERVLQSHPAIAAAAVLGVPDAKWGEAGWAFLQLHGGATLHEEELRAWCQQHLARFQCPAKFVLMDQLPLGHSGKIDKRILREQIPQQPVP